MLRALRGEGCLVIYRLIASFKEEKRKVNVDDAGFRISPSSLSLSQLEFLSADCHLPSFDLAPLSRNLSFILFSSSDQIKFGFLGFFTAKVTDCPKNYFYLFLFFDKFNRHFAMRWSYVQKPLFSILKKVSAPITSTEYSRGR